MLISVDTNVLLDQAFETEDVLDALDVIRERLPKASFIVTPTVLEELAAATEAGGEKAAAALLCFRQLDAWGYEGMDVIPVGKGITEEIGRRLRASGVVPDEEVRDAEIIAEAALLGCVMLLSSDRHLLDAQQHPRFHAILRDAQVDGDALMIARPRTIASKYLRR